MKDKTHMFSVTITDPDFEEAKRHAQELERIATTNFWLGFTCGCILSGVVAYIVALILQA